jgi:hypothetical protein
MRDLNLLVKTDPTIKRRFLNKISVDNGCWIWKACTDKLGYARIKIGGGKGRAVEAHIIAFILFVGDISVDLEIDHTCRRRNCVNPAHLEQVTHQVNMQRSFNATKTHCKHGHEYGSDNLFIDIRGHRNCRICMRDRGKRSQDRRRNVIRD